jgi:hypothetical protein
MINPFDLDDRVIAAAVAATGSIIGALIQLRFAWKKEVAARARGTPVTKKSRRGPVTAVVILLVAAGVGGFVLSESLVERSQRETAELRGELRTQLEQINTTAARLELATMSDRSQLQAIDIVHVPEAVTVTTTVGPCHARAAVGGNPASSSCLEQDAQRVTLCASVPASASVSDTTLYARPEDSTQPWANSRVNPGQDVGRARFADKPAEHPESSQIKQVCAGFSAWDSDHAYSARLVVKYSPATVAPAAAAAPAAPEAAGPAVRQPDAPSAPATHSADVPGAPVARPPESTNPTVPPITAAAH